MQDHQLAQVNIAHLVAPQDDPAVQGFFDLVPEINALAESSAGYIWRFEGDYPDPTVAFNLSVWESIEALQAFVYRSAHVEVFRRRSEWFNASSEAHLAMWWIEAGHIPSRAEAIGRLKYLQTHGPSEQAFDFTHRYSPPCSATNNNATD